MTNSKRNILQTILTMGYRSRRVPATLTPTIHYLRWELQGLMGEACFHAEENVGALSVGQEEGIVLNPKLAALLNVVTTIHLYREIKERGQGDKTETSESVRQLRYWFRAYAQASTIRMRTNVSVKHAVQLHLGPQGYQTWALLEALGYNPLEEDFWVELGGCLAAQSTVDILQTIDGSMFLGA